MLVHPLCCNDDRAGEIGPTFHFMTRHDLVLANNGCRGKRTRCSSLALAVTLNQESDNWRNIALAQVCAFLSPLSGEQKEFAGLVPVAA